MKKLLSTLIIAFLMFPTITNAQFNKGKHTDRTGIQIGLYQDLMNGISDDDFGNTAFNPSILIDIELQGNQQKWGFFSMGFGFGYTDLQNPLQERFPNEAKKLDFGQYDYKRFYVKAGYTFNELIVENLEESAHVTYGLLARWASFETFGANFALSYRLSEDSPWSVSIMSHFVNRKDKEFAYGNDARYTIESLKTDFSGYVGITYRIPSYTNRSKPTRF